MIHVRTESGSLYVLDWYSPSPHNPRGWERREAGKGSCYVRTTGGALFTFPSIQVGRRMVMLGPSLTPGGTFRLIETTPVQSIEWIPEAL